MGMMCNIGELETAVREKIPVVCVVFNDQRPRQRARLPERALRRALLRGGLPRRGLRRARARASAPTASASRSPRGSPPRSSARSKAAFRRSSTFRSIRIFTPRWFQNEGASSRLRCRVHCPCGLAGERATFAFLIPNKTDPRRRALAAGRAARSHHAHAGAEDGGPRPAAHGREPRRRGRHRRHRLRGEDAAGRLHVAVHHRLAHQHAAVQHTTCRSIR